MDLFLLVGLRRTKAMSQAQEDAVLPPHQSEMLSPASRRELPQSGFINRSYTSYRMEIWRQRG